MASRALEAVRDEAAAAMAWARDEVADAATWRDEHGGRLQQAHEALTVLEETHELTVANAVAELARQKALAAAACRASR